MKEKRRGFSLIEMLISLGVVIIISVAAFLNLTGKRNVTNLSDATVQAVALLREAQSHSMSQYKGTSWGVRFMNATNTPAFYSLFRGAYSTTTREIYVRLPAGVAYVTSTLATGTFNDIIFSQVSGIASASTTIRFYLPNQPSQSSTISVASSGAIIY